MGNNTKQKIIKTTAYPTRLGYNREYNSAHKLVSGNLRRHLTI